MGEHEEVDAIGGVAADAGPPPLLEFKSVTKRFGPLTVLDGVSFDVRPGEVHAVMGENGAGKSTLIKVLAGVHRADGGTITYDGRDGQFDHPRQAQEAGVSVVYQEFSLLVERTVAQNIYLGREPRTHLGLVDRRAMHASTKELLARLRISDRVRPDTVVRDLPVALQQMVEIAKALSFDARVVVMDEPTAALSPAESEALFDRIRELVERDVAVVYVSHRMPEVFALSDRITVLRDGVHVGTRPTADLDVDDVVSMMVGRPLDDLFPSVATADEIGEERLALRAAGNRSLDALDLVVRSGEIVGVGGLEGAGQAELAQALFGVVPFDRGAVEIDGESVRFRSPRDAIAAGVALVPSDRKQEGLVLGLSINDNIALPARSVRSVKGRIAGSMYELARRVMAAFDLRARSLAQPVGTLSGGNQQKVSIGRWVVSGCGILVLHEPTRGIDIQAKALTHEKIRELARDGAAVVVISSDLPELIGLSDRIVVMRDGAFVGELAHGCGESDVMRLAVHDADSSTRDQDAGSHGDAGPKRAAVTS